MIWIALVAEHVHQQDSGELYPALRRALHFGLVLFVNPAMRQLLVFFQLRHTLRYAFFFRRTLLRGTGFGGSLWRWSLCSGSVCGEIHGIQLFPCELQFML